MTWEKEGLALGGAWSCVGPEGVPANPSGREQIIDKCLLHGEKASFLQLTPPLTQDVMSYVALKPTEQADEYSLFPVSQQEPGGPGFWSLDGKALCFLVLISHK